MLKQPHELHKKKAERKQHHKGKAEDATVKPTLEEELTKFKAIVRHITRHEADHDQSNGFKAESRNRLRRLANL